MASKEPERVLIVGATSAIASAVARRYAARGARLYLLARSGEKLEQLARELGAAVVGTALGDFDEHQQNVARVAQALRTLGTVDVALIAHGTLGDQLETERTFAAARTVIDTNFASVVSFLVPLANQLERQQSGTIAVITSVAGERGRPRNYTYGAAKAALNVYLQGMRSRLFRANVQVVTLKLGPVDTPMTAHHTKNALFATTESAADGILAAIDGGVAEAYVPSYWAPIMAVVRGLPEPIFQALPFLSRR